MGSDDNESADDYKDEALPRGAGVQRAVWDLRYEAPRKIKNGRIDTGDPRNGPRVPPGDYTVKLTAGGKTLTAPLKVVADPRGDLPQADLDAQAAFAVRVRDDISKLTDLVNQLRSVQEQLKARNAALEPRKAESDVADLMRTREAAIKKAFAIEDKLHNPTAEVVYDILAMRGGARLYSRLSPLQMWAIESNGAPTAGMTQVLAETGEGTRRARGRDQAVPVGGRRPDQPARGAAEPAVRDRDNNRWARRLEAAGRSLTRRARAPLEAEGDRRSYANSYRPASSRSLIFLGRRARRHRGLGAAAPHRSPVRDGVSAGADDALLRAVEAEGIRQRARVADVPARRSHLTLSRTAARRGKPTASGAAADGTIGHERAKVLLLVHPDSPAGRDVGAERDRALPQGLRAGIRSVGNRARVCRGMRTLGARCGRGCRVLSAICAVNRRRPRRPAAIAGIAHVAIQTSDLAKARAFYGGLLGFPEIGAGASAHGDFLRQRPPAPDRPRRPAGRRATSGSSTRFETNVAAMRESSPAAARSRARPPRTPTPADAGSRRPIPTAMPCSSSS